MEDKPPRISSMKPRNHHRFASEEAVDSLEDCTGKRCRSCAAALIADCVAVCCCPLALVSLLALAFVKVPYLVCRKCLRKRRRERKRKKIIAETGDSMVIETSTSIGSTSQGKSDSIIFEFGDHKEFLEERKSFCAAFEADKVFLELYQEVGHLGFGRVSFTGIESFGKANY